MGCGGGLLTPALRNLEQTDREFNTSLGYSEFHVTALSLCWMGSDQFPVASIESARFLFNGTRLCDDHTHSMSVTFNSFL